MMRSFNTLEVHGVVCVVSEAHLEGECQLAPASAAGGKRVLHE